MPHSYTHMLVLHTNFMHANKMKVNWFICGTRRLSGGERKGLGGTNQWPEGSASFTGDTLAAVPHSHTHTFPNTHTYTHLTYVTKSTTRDPIDISQNGRRGDNNPKSLMPPMDGNCKTQWIGKCFVSFPIITQTGGKGTRVSRWAQKRGLNGQMKLIHWPNERVLQIE